MSLTPDTILKQSLELFSPPLVYTRLNALLSEANPSANDIGHIINTDPALTARLLRVVNSSYYGFPSQIDTTSRAVAIVGIKELTQIVLATSVIGTFPGLPSDLMAIDDFWRHSLACAITANLLAKANNHREPEQLFIAGLLQNIGSLVLYQSVPELAKEAITNALFGQQTLYEAEQALLGFDHSEMGAVLAEKWQLPPVLINTIRYHHSPMAAKHFSREVAIVHIADILVSGAAIFGHAGDRYVARLSPDAWQQLNIDITQCPMILQQVSDKIDDLLSALITA